jgi:hypothetical protein
VLVAVSKSSTSLREWKQLQGSQSKGDLEDALIDLHASVQVEALKKVTVASAKVE